MQQAPAALAAAGVAVLASTAHALPSAEPLTELSAEPQTQAAAVTADTATPDARRAALQSRVMAVREALQASLQASLQAATEAADRDVQPGMQPAVQSELPPDAALPQSAAAPPDMHPFIAQANNWTNWPKWSKWSNWANK